MVWQGPIPIWGCGWGFDFSLGRLPGSPARSPGPLEIVATEPAGDIDHLADEELSIGPYVLSGGELAAMVVMETVARLLPGFLGNPESLKEESFAPPRSTLHASRSVEYPQYTKPDDFMGWKIPKVLLSGNHAKIGEWREKHSKTQ